MSDPGKIAKILVILARILAKYLQVGSSFSKTFICAPDELCCTLEVDRNASKNKSLEEISA